MLIGLLIFVIGFLSLRYAYPRLERNNEEAKMLADEGRRIGTEAEELAKQGRHWESYLKYTHSARKHSESASKYLDGTVYAPFMGVGMVFVIVGASIIIGIVLHNL